MKGRNGHFPEFNVTQDGYWGKVLKINLPDGEFIAHPVRNGEKSTKSIEFIIKTEGSWTLYSEITVTSSNRPFSRKVWLAFKVGSDDPKPYGDGEHEWLVYCSPEPIGGNWIKIKANLPDNVSKTFGLNGWKYDSLLGFRIRGQLTIAKIDMFG